MALSELLNIAKYSSGYHGDGAEGKAPDLSFLFPNQYKKQQTALKLQQIQALVQKTQAEAAIEQRKQQLWNSVGTPAVSDKSTAGDVSKIVDDEKVGGRDAQVVNDGKVAMDAAPAANIPANTNSGSSLVNLMKSFQPTISPAGNMILSRPKSTKQPDQAKTFGYAKRLADQSIINSGKTRKDISNDDYKTLVDNNMPQAEKFLYGQLTSAPTDTSSDSILSKAKQYNGVAKNYDEAKTFTYAKRLADQAIVQSGKRRKEISPEDYKTLVNDQIPQAEKYLYGQVLSQPDAPTVTPQANLAAGAEAGLAAGQGQFDGQGTPAPAPAQQATAPQVQSYNEGQTAVNPKTGKRLVFKGGRWQALN